MLNKEEFLKFCRELAPNAGFVFMDPKETVFEENIKMNCFYCGKYGNNWKCPPHLPANIDYPKMFAEFDEGLFVVCSFDVTDAQQFEIIRTESSVTVHKILLKLEKWMYDHDIANAVSFGAGSCKLCKGGCGKERCNNPYMSRSPMEATGMNVVKTAEKFGIDIHFPTDKKLMRVGLLLWQNRKSTDI